MANQIRISTSEKLFGSQSMEINPDGGAASVLTDLAKTNFVSLLGLSAVTVSCYIKASAYTNGYIIARAVFFDANDAQLGTHDWVTLSATNSCFTRFYQTYLLGQAPVPANTVKMKLQFGGIQKASSNPNFDIFIDGVKVEQGDKLTAYTDYTLKENDSLDLVGDGVTFKRVAGVSSNNQVTTSSIENSAVISSKIADGAVATAKIAAGAVTTNELGNNAVTTGKIAGGAVTSNELGASAVVDTKIASGAVTTDKIGSNAVDNTKLADNAVTTQKIQDGSVSNAKVANGSLTEDRFDSNLNTKLSNLKSDGSFKGDVYAGNGTTKLIDASTGRITSDLQTSSGASVNERVEQLYSDVYDKDIAVPVLDKNVSKSQVHGTYKTYRPGTTTADINIGDIGDSWDILFDLTRADTGEDLLDATGTPITVMALWKKQDKSDIITTGSDPFGVGAGWTRNDGDGVNNSTWIELSAVPTVNFNLVYSIRKKLSTLQTRDLVTVGVIKGGQSDANVMLAIQDLKGTTNWNDTVPNGRKLTDLTATKDGGITYVIADGKVKGTSIAAGEVGTTHLADGAVSTSKLPDNTVTTEKINAGAVTGNKIASGTITGSNIANGTITGTQVASSTITGSNIANATVNQGNMANGSVGSNQLIDANVTTNKIANNAVDNSKLADNSVGTSKIANTAVDSTKLADNAVTTNKINANAVDSSKIASGAVGNTQLANSAVDSNKIASNAVIAGKIASNAVVNGNIADGAITDSKISDGSVTTSERFMVGTHRKYSIRLPVVVRFHWKRCFSVAKLQQMI